MEINYKMKKIFLLIVLISSYSFIFSQTLFTYGSNAISKEEFLNYVGHLYYAKYRCIEIYDRLQDIEDEA